METKDKKESTLFKKFYNMTEDVMKKLKEPLIERATKRKFEAAYDSCKDQIIETETDFNKQMENVENIDLNKLLQIRQKAKNAEKTMVEIAAMYEEFFGTKLAA
jgi:hypothetical protein